MFPKESWTRIYTDGQEEQISLSTGFLYTNYKAETETLRHAANTIANKFENQNNIVFLSDALSVLQAMKSYKDRDLNNTIGLQSFQELSKKHVVAIHRIPSQCNLLGNENADEFANREL